MNQSEGETDKRLAEPDPGIDWNRAYDNRGAVAGSEAFPDKWAAEAAAFRAEAHGASNPGKGARFETHAYGAGAREAFDLFTPAGATPRGLLAHVHGGYWLRGDRALYSHLAAGPLARGWAVALPSYPLAPEARIQDITRRIAAAVSAAAERVAGPIRLSGHSAGGHLVARLACADSPLDPAIAARLERVTSISGLHDLRPLLNTAMAAELRLDAEEAAAESPALLAPRPDLAVVAWVGAAELPEFLRQNALLAAAWRGRTGAIRAVEDPGHDHFTVIEPLATADAPLTDALCG